MAVIASPNGIMLQVPFDSENDLERKVVSLGTALFGRGRVYIDVKKKIVSKGAKQNIPDGYLIDLASSNPRLYVVENEMSSHDPLRHVAVQLLEFSIAFENSGHRIKSILLEALDADQKARRECEQFVQERGYRNLDHLLEKTVFDHPFAAIVVIDQMSDDLRTALATRFKFGVEVIEINRFRAPNGEVAYYYEPFLSGLIPDTSVPANDLIPDIDEIDTIVVPSHEAGFEETFLGENCWHAVRIHGTMRPQIKYIAVYRIRPVSAITHIAPVRSIEPWGDAGKSILYFSEPAKAIGPIPAVANGRVKPPQNIRYTTRTRLLAAKTLEDVF